MKFMRKSVYKSLRTIRIENKTRDNKITEEIKAKNVKIDIITIN